MLKLIHNHPVNFDVLKNIYKDIYDLQMAWPDAKYPFNVDQWKDYLNSAPQHSSLLFEQDSCLIGHILLKMTEGNHLYICFVILDKKFRGQGLIYEMFRLTEEYAQAKYNSDTLWLHVDPSNLPAYKAYQKMGYQLVRITEAGRCRMAKRLIP